MRWLLIPLLWIALAHAEDFQLLHVGGDGHVYLITEKLQLQHVHREQRTDIDVGRVQSVIANRTGVFASAAGQIWLVEEGRPTPIADGYLVELAETSEGAYMLLWDEGLKAMFLPY